MDFGSGVAVVFIGTAPSIVTCAMPGFDTGCRSTVHRERLD